MVSSATSTQIFATVATEVLDSPDVTGAITVHAQEAAQQELRQQGFDLEALEALGVAATVDTAISNAIRSDDFSALVAPQLEAAHGQFVAELTQESREPAPLVLSFEVSELVNQQIGEDTDLGALVPSVDIAPVQVEVVDARVFEKARTGFTWLDLASTLGLVMGLVCVAGGLLVTPRRPWFLAKFSLAVGAVCFVGWAAVMWRGPRAATDWFGDQGDPVGGALGQAAAVQIIDAVAAGLLARALMAFAVATVCGALAFAWGRLAPGSGGGIRHRKAQ